jgi:heterodisulfide reductase subunit A
MSKRRIGVYVCHCGGNISDYVDVAEVAARVQGDDEVVVAKTSMFACADATQTEIEKDIREQKLDGLVVASCSPKLHTFTFRGVATRAGLNPFEYTQVNIREQCSWVHTDNRAAATQKATALVKAGVARTRLTQPYEPIVVKTTPKALVIGGGIAGLRAALGLAQIGLAAFLVEREEKLGGWIGRVGPMFPSDRDGRELIAKLEAAVRSHPLITVFTSSEVVSKSGSFGNYDVEVRVGDKPGELIRLRVGSLVVTTGSDTYQPAEGEFGYGIEGVVTLPQFKELVDASEGGLMYRGQAVRSIAYVYCVGSRQGAAGGKNEFCSRYCCAATTHTAIQVSKLDPSIRQFHLYRDIRTYGRYEELYA